MPDTIRTAKRDLTQIFVEAGLPFADEDALEIILAVTGFDKTALILRGSEAVSPDMSTLIESYKDRRLSGEPIDHILGWREFYGRRFKISKDVLSPRADTETLIRGALKRLHKIGSPALLDLGTGSGAIGLTCLAEIADARLIATDLSEAALDIAKTNAQTLNVTQRATFHHGAWWDAVAKGSRFDIILSNPPYITDAAMITLEREVLEYDPDIALRGGADGLNAYRAIISDAPKYLKPKGWLGLEIGFDQAEGLKSLLKSEIWGNITVDKDLGGLNRSVWAQKLDEI